MESLVIEAAGSGLGLARRALLLYRFSDWNGE
jgi:hypothetical protein